VRSGAARLDLPGAVRVARAGIVGGGNREVGIVGRENERVLVSRLVRACGERSGAKGAERGVAVEGEIGVAARGLPERGLLLLVGHADVGWELVDSERRPERLPEGSRDPLDGAGRDREGRPADERDEEDGPDHGEASEAFGAGCPRSAVSLVFVPQVDQLLVRRRAMPF
jgi:hypothetical protein